MGQETDVEILVNNLDENDISSILRTYNEVNQVKKAVEEKLNMLKDKLKASLKERQWDNYKDENSKISVSITTQQREKVNKKSLKMLLNEEQYNQVVTKTSFEKMMVVTPEDRERLKQYGKK